MTDQNPKTFTPLISLHVRLIQHAFFEEVAVSTLRYLDMLYERGDMEKSQFFKKSLARVVTKLPKVGVLKLSLLWHSALQCY